ncbi:hypothetical protein HB662_13540 [Roseomonas frigidaquae]|uniref:DUF2569 domain-containing protein n=1 Tax=Falsiroseomonas frigidaquae TaxID=487318 RepID=A0ABX1F0F8_9PROT|nr:hypothetical protein [Falsiroseomonas frigidaquae]NKE45809.1 hypothetical protein [Falsiroseomonas frigidaquae]
MAKWVRVGPAVAEAHPLHGMGGWLRVPSFFLALAVLGSPFLLVREWRPPGAPDALLLNLDLLLSIGLTLAATVLWFRRWRHFRPAYVWVFLVLDSALQLAGFLLAPGLRGAADPAEAVAEMVAGLAFLLPLAIAMQRSRRYRVTFEQRLRAEEAALTPPPTSHSPGLPPAPSC